MTDSEIASDFDPDEMFVHFEDSELSGAHNIETEAKRILGIILQCEIEFDSPIDAVISSAVMLAEKAAIGGVARMLGVDPGALSGAASEYIYGTSTRKHNELPSIGIEKFQENLAEYERWKEEGKPEDWEPNINLTHDSQH
jgi:hypothetical protein